MTSKTNITHWEELPDVLTTEQVANFLQISFNTVKRMFKDGEIKAVKLSVGWRVNKTELMRLMQLEDNQITPSSLAALSDTITRQSKASLKKAPASEIITDLKQATEILTAQGHEELATRLLAYEGELVEIDDELESDSPENTEQSERVNGDHPHRRGGKLPEEFN